MTSSISTGEGKGKGGRGGGGGSPSNLIDTRKPQPSPELASEFEQQQLQLEQPQQQWAPIFTRRTFLTDLKHCIKDLVLLFSTRGVVSESDPELRRFCLTMEKVFLHGLINQKSRGQKQKRGGGGGSLDETSYRGGGGDEEDGRGGEGGRGSRESKSQRENQTPKDYWSPLMDWMSTDLEKMRDVLEAVHSPKTQATTPQGKGRCFLLVSLALQSLETYLGLFIQQKHILGRWYNSNSVWKNEEATVVVGLMRQLSFITFRLNLPKVNFDELHRVGVGESFVYSTSGATPGSPTPFLNDSPSSPGPGPGPGPGPRKSSTSNLAHTQPTFNASPRGAPFEPTPSPSSSSAIAGRKQKENAKVMQQFLELENRSKALLLLSPISEAKNKPLEEKLKLFSEESSQLRDVVLDLKKAWTEHIAGFNESNSGIMVKDETPENKASNIVVAITSKIQTLIEANSDIWEDFTTRDVIQNTTIEKLRVSLEEKERELKEGESNFQKRMEEKEKEMDERKRTMEQVNLNLAQLNDRVRDIESSLSQSEMKNMLLREKLQHETVKGTELTKKLEETLPRLTEAENKNKELSEELQHELSKRQTLEDGLEEMNRKMEAEGLKKETETPDAESAQANSKNSGIDAAWTPDDAVTQCANCSKAFSFTRRRHHCRRCGNLFCASCTENRVILSSKPTPVRCCDPCFLRIQDQR